MLGHFKYYLFAISLIFLNACGAGGTQNSPTASGYNWTWDKNGNFVAPSVDQQKLAFQTVGNDEKVQVEETGSGSSKQFLITGETKLEGFTSGSISVSALEATVCNQGYCALEGKAPLAASSGANPGFFSLVVPNYSGHVILKATHLAPDGVKYQAQMYLGVLSARKDAILLSLLAE